MEWFGRAKIDFVHAPSPRTIKETNGNETDLVKICEATTPPCNLNPLLFNGHLQTCWTATHPHGPRIYYRRKVFESEHETYAGSFAVDFVTEPFEEEQHDDALPWRTALYTDEEFASIGSDDSKPMLLVLHGLSGGSHEVYLREAIAPLANSGNWDICILNSRGCARHKITSGVLYNARATWDTRQTVKWMKKTFPNRPLFAIGFSLGANILTNYCGEEGSDCLLKAVIACSSPFNLEISSKMLARTFIGRELYLRVLGSAMKELVRRNEKEIKKFTNLHLEAISKTTYLHEFDRVVQCPTWGYPTESAYYRDASSADAVGAIRIPFMALSALDDPVVAREAIPFEEFKSNPNTVLITTSLGGHLCWFELGGTRWHTRPICNFLNYFAQNVDLDAIVPESSPIKSAFYREADFDPMRRKMDIPR